MPLTSYSVPTNLHLRVNQLRPIRKLFNLPTHLPFYTYMYPSKWMLLEIMQEMAYLNEMLLISQILKTQIREWDKHGPPDKPETG
jgi:hypothetical protein